MARFGYRTTWKSSWICLSLATCVMIVATVPIDPDHSKIKHHGRSPWSENLLKWINLPFLKAPSNHRYTDSRNIYATYQAVTFGNGHIVTFDGRYYHMPDGIGATCPHILSRDQAKFQFMILRNSNSITLYTTNTVITLHNNNKVEVNNTGVYRDLPVQSWDDSVSVIHNNEAVFIETKRGVMIECDLHHTECLYKLTGSFYNHTTGLLGTNDDDASNDLLLPSGRVAIHLQEFLNYYELSGSSICRPATVSTDEKCSSEMTNRCQHLFSDPTSLLAACYSKVAPEPFMLACLYDAERCDTRHKDHRICDAVRAYIRICKSASTSVPLPRECGRCHHHHKIDSTWSEETQRKLDIVLIASLKRNWFSSNNSIGTVLSSVFSNMITGLRNEARLHNVRVGLLGYSGSGYLSEPHVYTVQGEAFTRHYSSAIWRQTVLSLEANGVWSTDPLIGIRSTLNYPFRADAVKMMLLLSEQVPNSQELQSPISELQSKGIILNIITSSEPEIYSSKVDGIHIREDIVELVRGTHGSAFDIAAISSADSHSMQLLSQKINQQVAHDLHRCRQCTCKLSLLGREISVCEEKSCV